DVGVAVVTATVFGGLAEPPNSVSPVLVTVRLGVVHPHWGNALHEPPPLDFQVPCNVNQVFCCWVLLAGQPLRYSRLRGTYQSREFTLGYRRHFHGFSQAISEVI